MATSLSLRTRQAQVFRFTHVVDLLRLSTPELEEHLARVAQENPLLSLPQRMSAGRSTTDLIEMMSVCDTPSLYDHATQSLAGLISQGGLLEQLVLALIEELDPTGWLGASLDTIATRLGIDLELVETTLKLIQRQIEPTGLFARSLVECLSLQLEEQGALDADMANVLDHIGVLETAGPEELARACGLSQSEVLDYLRLIRSLDPKPGASFYTNPTLLRDPDVVVTRGQSGWDISFTNPALAEFDIWQVPHRHRNAALNEVCTDARSLKQALHLRQSAIRDVVNVLVRLQSDYFSQGISALHPLTMSDVAQEAGFHLSTVSRVMNGLLIEGPHGIISAKLLCPGATTKAALHSKPQVQARIRSLIASEPGTAPLTDSCVKAALDLEGITVSRRIVAKYRQELGVPPASRRRCS